MAENLLAKQIDYVTRLVDLAGQLDALLYAAQQLTELYPFMGDLSDPAIWENGGIQHTSAADLATLKTRLEQLVAWFNANDYRDVLREVQR